MGSRAHRCHARVLGRSGGATSAACAPCPNGCIPCPTCAQRSSSQHNAAVVTDKFCVTSAAADSSANGHRRSRVASGQQVPTGTQPSRKHPSHRAARACCRPYSRAAAADALASSAAPNSACRVLTVSGSSGSQRRLLERASAAAWRAETFSCSELTCSSRACTMGDAWQCVNSSVE